MASFVIQLDGCSTARDRCDFALKLGVHSRNRGSHLAPDSITSMRGTRMFGSHFHPRSCTCACIKTIRKTRCFSVCLELLLSAFLLRENIAIGLSGAVPRWSGILTSVRMQQKMTYSRDVPTIAKEAADGHQCTLTCNFSLHTRL